MSYLSEFYQSAKETARRSISDQPAQSAIEKKQADLKADITLRLGALGFSAATGGIGLIAMQANTPVLAIASFALSASSILGLAALKRKIAPHVALLANGAAWISATGFVANSHPVAAAVMLATLGASLYKAELFAGQSQDASGAHDEVEQSQEVEIQSSPCLNAKGEAVRDFCLGEFTIKAGQQLTERLHLTDRVSFLRALSELRSGAETHVAITVRVNLSATNDVPQYEAVSFAMQKDGELILLSPESAIAKDDFIHQTGEESSNQQDNNRFLTIVSHELRTPLNAIIGFSDVLRNDIGRSLPQETRDEYTNLIHGAGTHLLSLVNTILDVSKLDSGAYEIHRDEFEFRSTARDCIAMLSGQAKIKNVKINDRMVGDLTHVNGDRRAIKQILINLLSNAIKYTNAGGFVTVDARQDQKGLWFEVSDTGIGMDEHGLQKIGKPFAQVDNSTTRNCEGTGLGLVLVKGLVDLHGGAMSISSKQGVGTRISVQIPTQVAAANTAVQSATLNQLKDMLPHVRLNTQNSDSKEISHGKRKVG